MFAIFFALWLASSGLTSLFGLASGGMTLGFYLSLLGYAAMVVGYYQLQAMMKQI